MKTFTKIEIVEVIESEDIEFINLQFTDLYGVLKTITVSSGRIDKILNNQCSVRKSALYNFINSEATQLYLKPILNTFCILPWRPQQAKVARFICDIYDEKGNEFQDDSRYILRKTIKHIEEMEYEILTNLTCSFFLFHNDEDGKSLVKATDSAGYMEAYANDFGLNFRRDLSLTFEDMGYQIEALFHEYAPAQQKIDFPYAPPIETADKFMSFKLATHAIAKRHGLNAVFMPKPKEEFNGSSMPLRICLLKNGKNLFEDKQGNINGVGQAFLSGILTHIKSMTAFCNPIVNSYKRLHIDYDAPSEIVWSTNQQKVVVLVQKDPDIGIVLELRSPDPFCNPYILIATCIEAGLDGIKSNLKIPEMVNGNIFNLIEVQKTKVNFEILPQNLGEALEIIKTDFWIKNILGDTFVKNYIYYKEKEWYNYRKHVSQWEIEQYLQPV